MFLEGLSVQELLELYEQFMQTHDALKAPEGKVPQIEVIDGQIVLNWAEKVKAWFYNDFTIVVEKNNEPVHIAFQTQIQRQFLLFMECKFHEEYVKAYVKYLFKHPIDYTEEEA